MIYQSNRLFSIFSYSMSHGLLLLRSGKSKLHPTRVDILFTDVRGLELRALLEGLTIEEVTPDYTRERSSRPNALIEIGNKVYRVSSDGWEGFVVGGIVRIHEDDGKLMEPSHLIET